MPKTYLIPHNYTNNGRIFNLFRRRDLTKALVWLVPATAFIFNLPIALNSKLFCEVLMAFPPAIAILAGYADWIGYLVRFMKTRKVYYNFKEGESHVYLFASLKKAKTARKSAKS